MAKKAKAVQGKSSTDVLLEVKGDLTDAQVALDEAKVAIAEAKTSVDEAMGGVDALLAATPPDPGPPDPVPPAEYTWNRVANAAYMDMNGISYQAECDPAGAKTWSLGRAAGCDVTRYEVRSGDVWPNDAGNRCERSELDGYRTTYANGVDIWGALSFLIEAGQAYKCDWNFIHQLHGKAGGPPLHVELLENDILTIVCEYEAGSRQRYTLYKSTAPVARGKWIAYVYHFKGNQSGQGRCECWLDGVKVGDRTGNLGRSGDVYYQKNGIYRGYTPITPALAIQVANSVYGNRDLSALIDDPTPIPVPPGR